MRQKLLSAALLALVFASQARAEEFPAITYQIEKVIVANSLPAGQTYPVIEITGGASQQIINKINADIQSKWKVTDYGCSSEIPEGWTPDGAQFDVKIEVLFAEKGILSISRNVSFSCPGANHPSFNTDYLVYDMKTGTKPPRLYTMINGAKNRSLVTDIFYKSGLAQLFPPDDSEATTTVGQASMCLEFYSPSLMRDQLKASPVFMKKDDKVYLLAYVYAYEAMRTCRTSYPVPLDDLTVNYGSDIVNAQSILGRFLEKK